MDRTDLGLPSNPPQSESAIPAGASSSPDLDRALWRQLLEASTPDAFYKAWLALQARLLRGVLGGVVVLGPPETGPFTPAASWPEGRAIPPHLASVAERAIQEGRGLVVPAEVRPNGEGVAPDHLGVAYPIHVAGRLHGVVAFEIRARPDRDLQAVLRQLQWGSAWIEVLWLREEATRDATIKERLQTVKERLRTVLDLAATALSHEGFFEAATAFVTAAATVLGCERVSVGFLRGDWIRVRAMSHSAEFADQTNLIRAIAAAMEEAIAGKLRAALTRLEPAIRDFFDIDYLISQHQFDLKDQHLIQLLDEKLKVPGNPPIDMSLSRKEKLKTQINTELKPVLRPSDFESFDLERAFEMITQIRDEFHKD